MLVEQFYISCLSQASYYIESNGEAAVFDASREINHFLEIHQEIKGLTKILMINLDYINSKNILKNIFI